VKTPQIGSAASTDSVGPKTDSARPTIVVVAGVDPRGGAGLFRDILTARARGAWPVAVGSAWTEQGAGVHRVEARDPSALRDAVTRAVAGAAAVKVGMVADPAGAAAVVEGLRAFEGPVVVDPVLSTSRGGTLFAGAPAALLGLARRAALLTPNAPEAAALTGRRVATVDDAVAAGEALRARGVAAALVKGGHLDGEDRTTVDVLVTAEGARRFVHERVAGGDVRGTGCALATAIAVELARGRALAEAIEASTAWLVEALRLAVDVGGERHLPQLA
jgi:hydroxymethylpyrimidine/phosphomethylpyrimidine kinase